MKRRDFLAASTFTPALGAVQASSAGAAATSESTSQTLFNGKSLAGWTIQNGPASAFYVDESGNLAGSPSAGFPAWLRSEKQYENFEFETELMLKGWTDGGIYLHAPEYGRQTWCGMQVKLFHQREDAPKANSHGSIYPLIAPSLVNPRNDGSWNQLRILMDWPALKVWSNGELVQDLNVESVPELRHRLRRGYLGLYTLSYPLRFRNLKLRELPSKERWDVLFRGAADLDKWFLTDKNERMPPQFRAYGDVMRSTGLGQLATRERYRDFALQLYVRGALHHNGGILFRSNGQGPRGRHYEIQLHDVEEAHYPTGSLYHHQRSIYPRIEPEQWHLVQLVVQGKDCLVRVNGETVMEYHRLENLDEGHIELQAHDANRWMEYKEVLVRRL
jgi:hypothetical protein